MNSPVPSEAVAPPGVASATSTISRLIRRIHMFTGLFLGPWMLMYALSTLVMTHREYVLSFYATKDPALVKERELQYSRSFAATATREQIAKQILEDLGLDGCHSVSGGRNGKPLVINRQHALHNQRVTFNSSAGQILIEREDFRALTFLERMHRRRGYNQPYALDDTWGFTVDFAVVTMVFWSLSGLWLWWELKSTRGWGTVSVVVGLGLFAVFLVLL